MTKNILLNILLILFISFGNIYANKSSDTTKYTLENQKVLLDVYLENGVLLYDNLKIKNEWSKQFNTSIPPQIKTDADFTLDIMYTDWSAPGKINNADNLILLAKKDFNLVNHFNTSENNFKELILNFKGKETPFDIRITYHLDNNSFFIKRNIAIMDTTFGHHFLRRFWTRTGMIYGITSLIKNGGFGQPVAVSLRNGGAFFGVEYPSAENQITKNEKNYSIRCGQEYGELIGNKWLQSDWVVEGITPNQYVKYWFFEYLNSVRVSPLRPYSLYNTWYDLRSPEYPGWSPEKAMSEKTSLQMVDILRKSMIEKYNIKLDAFVLDDGWDVYESDWVLRKEEWPHGLKPLADELKKTNTSLGVWLGPTGGYSFRMRRINWMKEQGYEVVGKSRDNSMLCVAGSKYRELLKKRVTDFVVNDGVGYYKWDGIQFSCSEPNHGHPIDIYSRRAVMESVADMCCSVREKNNNIFLNITSGTWLSPWWLKYANTIWMQGMDYGFSDVPSISQRDAAITYRDFVLYDDFNIQNMWFPIANLMTHGIIKGKHESVGVESEPLDKFTDDVLLYFARGVSMYELYISPDILTDGEWKSIAASMAWARDRFSILMNSEMVGGNPLKGEAYAHIHFKDMHGIIAARNPVIEPTVLKIKLDPALGFDPKASSIVVEKTYPVKWISPNLYKSGDIVDIPLDGFETAIYEVYPVMETDVPLLAGVYYDVVPSDGEYTVQFHNSSVNAKLLNPSVVKSVLMNGKKVEMGSINLKTDKSPEVFTGLMFTQDVNDKSKFRITLDVSETTRESKISLLVTPDTSLRVKNKPIINATVNGKSVNVITEPQSGRSQWYMVELNPGRNDIAFQVYPGKEEKEWKGNVSVWMIAKQKQNVKEITFKLNKGITQKPQVPHVWELNEIRKNKKIIDIKI